MGKTLRVCICSHTIAKLSQKTEKVQSKRVLHRLSRKGVSVFSPKATGLTETPSFSAIIPSTGIIDPKSFKQPSTISSYETELNSRISKECSKQIRYYSSLDSKRLVRKGMPRSCFKNTPNSNKIKRLVTLRPKPIKNSIFSESPINKQKSCVDSKKRTIIRTVYPEINTKKRALQHKPTITAEEDIVAVKSTYPQVIAAEASHYQALVADAESDQFLGLIPARNQTACNSALDNKNTIPKNYSKINDNYSTNNGNNTDTVENKYCTTIDKSERQVELLCGLNYKKSIDPYLSDTLIEISDKPGKLLDNASIVLVNNIDTLNKLNIDTASTQGDSDKDKVIAEVLLPIATNNKDKITEAMDLDLSQIWGGDELFSDAQLIEQHMDMVIVDPLEVGGFNADENAMRKNQSTTASPTEEEQSANSTQPENDNNPTLEDLMETIESLDQQYITSIINDVEQTKERNVNENNVPEQDAPDLLAMLIRDEIGEYDFANAFGISPCSTLNPQDIGITVKNEPKFSIPSANEEVNQSQDETLNVPAPKRKGPGRPRKPRTERTPKPRGRPAKPLSESPAPLTDHHNYSSDAASTSDSSSNGSVVIQRYRRMRDLNNVASQRCRLRRREKMQEAFDELIQQENRNKDLTMKVKVLEEQVSALKARFLDSVANPAPAFDLTQLVEDTATQFGM